MDPEENEFECVSVLSGHSQDVKSVVFHPTKEWLLSCSYDDTIKIWESDDYDWTCRQTLEGHTSTVWSAAFSSDGNTLVSASDDRTLILWKLDETDQMYQRTETLSGHHQRCVFSVDMDQKGRLLSGGGDDAIRVFVCVSLN